MNDHRDDDPRKAAGDGRPPLIYAAGLWEGVGRNGKRYLRGHMGQIQVLVFERDQKSPHDPTHALFFGRLFFEGRTAGPREAEENTEAAVPAAESGEVR